MIVRNKLWLGALLLLTLDVCAQDYTAGDVRYRINTATGALAEVARSGRVVVSGTENHYFVRRKSGDAEAWEQQDKLTGQAGNYTLYSNPGLPHIRIGKSYSLSGQYLRRHVRFENRGSDTAFITLRTRTKFTPEFYQQGFYLGAGYIGPLIPVPQISAPRRVTQYKQSTKGMLLYHDRGQLGSFAHYRLTLDGNFVFPWWQSAIVNYIEPENHLYYHPDGWEMSLGTVDVAPGKSLEITDTFIAFPGSWYNFMNEIYTGDPVVAKTLHNLKPGPEWLQEVCAYVKFNAKRDIQQLAAAIGEGDIMVLSDYLGGWSDYRLWNYELYPGQNGGAITAAEHREFLHQLQRISPRVKVGSYMFVNSAFHNSEIVREHPEYFMFKDRAGRPKNLFPGQFVHNFPTMVNRAPAQNFLINDIFRRFIDEMKVDFIYLDETKTTNLIDWQRNDCVRDDDWNKFWRKMYDLGKEKHVVMFSNGRGNPYHELNFIEAAAQLNPRYWRQFAGMALAVAALENHRAGGRICLLYWRDNVDYIDRVLANGFIPALFPFRVRQFPFIRAVAENGALNVTQLKYSPDWKNDPETGLESYATKRRLGGETLLSIIRREKSTRPEVQIDLKNQPAQLAIWGYRIARYQARLTDCYAMGDQELRQVYRQNGWRESIIAEPELLYCGANPGTFTAKLPGLGIDRMAILAIGNPVGGVYSVDGLPQNFFYGTTRQVKLLNAQLPLQVSCQARDAEIIMFQRNRKFTVNGQVAKTRYAEFGGQYFTIVTVPQGKSVIADAGSATPPENLLRVRRDGILRSCETAFKLPRYQAGGTLTIVQKGHAPRTLLSKPGARTATMRIPMPTLHPDYVATQPGLVLMDDMEISDSAVFTSRWRNATSLQGQVAPFTAVANLRNLTLQVGTTRRVADSSGSAAAGFLLHGAKQVELQLEHTFDLDGGILRGHVSRYHRKSPEFAGLFVDYRTNKGWERVAFTLGNVMHNRPAPGVHPWGAKHSAQRIYQGPADWLDRPGQQRFTLNLQRFAPKNWTGEAWLTAGTSFILPGRQLQFTLCRANQQCQAAEPQFRDYRAELRWLNAPRQLTVPRISGTVDFKTVWQHGQGAGNFALIRNGGRPRHDSEFRLAHDGKNLYAAVKISADSAGENAFELWLYNAKVRNYLQIIAEADGRVNCLKGPIPDSGLGVKVYRHGNEVLFIVPTQWIGQPLTGQWRFNICRARAATLTAAPEYSSWSVLNKGFGDVAHFGTITFE